MNILGIDPGASGACAIVGDCDAQSWAFKNLTEKDILELLRDLAPKVDKAIMEQVASRPGQGVSSMFKFGQHFGGLRMALLAAGIPFETVTPQAWKAKVGLARKPKETQVAYKNRSKAKAQQLFPHLTIGHANAEALLLAWYGSRL